VNALRFEIKDQIGMTLTKLPMIMLAAREGKGSDPAGGRIV